MQNDSCDSIEPLAWGDDMIHIFFLGYSPKREPNSVTGFRTRYYDS